MSRYLFRAKILSGFNLKVISELLSNFLKFSPFRIDSNGISLCAADQNREILIDLHWPKENLASLKCPNMLYFIVNSTHFYRLLKTIKKKDSVTLFISEDMPMKLGICVEQNDENSDKVTTYINITYMQPEDIDLPTGYDEEDPIIETSKRFQRLKLLHNVGNEMKISISGKLAKCFVNGKNLYSREVTLGNEEEEDDNQSEHTYSQTFSTPYLTHLTKCAQQSGNIQIFHHEELPLKIKLKTANLGDLTVFIKSKELQEMEQEDNEVETDMKSSLDTSEAKKSGRKKKTSKKTEEEEDESEDQNEEEEVEA